MKLDTLKLLNLMPKFMRDDETTNAMCEAIELEIASYYKAQKKSMALTDLDNAPEWLLDEVAWEYNVTWYNTNSPIEIKRRIIKSAEYVKKHLGTVAAVERTISDYFDDGTVEEWPDFNGEPYTFRVRTTNSKITDEHAELFKMALNATKNARSHLEGIYIDRRADMPEYIALTYHEGEILNLSIGGL